MDPAYQKYAYIYQQQTARPSQPGPPQPQWQTPPRGQGWVDPRPQQQPEQHQQQPYAQPSVTQQQQQQQPFSFPPPPLSPPPPTQPPRPPTNQYNTQSWGVKYNQSQPQQNNEFSAQLSQQNEELKPPLPPRPLSSAGHHAPTFQSEQWPSSQPPPTWQEPYLNQSQASSSDIPPPPPPRPPEYQAQLQAQYQSDTLPHQPYSHRPLSHHYEPSVQNHQPSAYPAPSADPALVSPVEPETHHWSQQSTGPPGPPAPRILQPLKTENNFYSSALGTGGPSDWEHFSDGQSVSPTVSSPPPAHVNLPPPPVMASPPGKSAAIAQSTFLSNESLQNATYNLAGPSQSSRQDSQTSSVPSQGINRTGTIDSLIQAWNKPLDVEAASVQQVDIAPESRAQVHAQGLGSVVAVQKVVEKIIDPYEDLEPEFKASLKRYVTMLRKESAAETDEAKFDLFRSFMKKEIRLRSMLYGVESQLQESRPADERFQQLMQDTPAQKSAVIASIPSATPHIIIPPNTKQSPVIQGSDSTQPTIESKPLSHQQPMISQPEKQTPQPVETFESKAAENSDVLVSQNNLVLQSQPMPTHDTSTTDSKNPNPRPSDDLFVVINKSIEDVEYSPGGRPRQTQQQDEDEFSPGGRPRINRPQVVTNKSKQQEIDSRQTLSNSQISPSADAPMVLEDYAMAQPQSPSANAPILIEPGSRVNAPRSAINSSNPLHARPENQASISGSELKLKSAPTLKFEPARPAYLPFKYNPAAVLAPTGPADQSYSSLRKDAIDSGRLLVHESTGPTPSLGEIRKDSQGFSRPQDEAFIGLIRSQSKAIRPKKSSLTDTLPLAQLRPGTPRGPSLAGEPVAPVATKPSQLAVATTELKAMLPESVPDVYGLSHHANALSLKATIDKFPDSFTFIHEAVIDWDRRNRGIRKTQDDERNTRQAESEAQIDGLFNDNEIGYADIGDLEAEFKLAEAERKYEEDQQELESFTKGVHQPVTERLQKDLSTLDTQYKVGMGLLDFESEPASRCLRVDSSKAEMGFVMTCVLSLFNKLEVRHQKVVEADVERERRRKRLELTVLYTNGDTPGVKKLEQEFAVAEKMQVLHEARARDARANKLMDTFDRATVRGLGDNQTYVDDLLMRVRELKELILKDPANISPDVYTADGPRDSLSLAQKTVDFVLVDSQKLLTISNVADKMLNDADYSVSVAEARVSNASEATYQKLAEEKEKEDTKIVEDTNSRMSSIGKAPEEAIILIREVVDKVGDDTDHQERIKKALEAARKRNASGEAGVA